MLDPSSFAYDQQAPLALEVLIERGQDGAIVRDIAYASPRGGRVPAYIILPIQQPPQAGLIFGHWGDGLKFYELASEPKQIAWYDNCNHELNALARLDRATWLCEKLLLARPSQEIVKLLERVPSPIPLES
jgi:hypothetical protein